ncbi:hypothetical protein Dsin_005255 [Dipteronia sinensis]|uniref:Uncharacterized protein n=1 Tax=Dipteronia sinensis TaxID=43782 RepID=A0AAE0AWY1_9ROSI|nr:hypothetical protein Dsin_005255 [Dipteronia sinensis]
MVIGELFLVTFLQVLFERLMSPDLLQFALREGLHQTQIKQQSPQINIYQKQINQPNHKVPSPWSGTQSNQETIRTQTQSNPETTHTKTQSNPTTHTVNRTQPALIRSKKKKKRKERERERERERRRETGLVHAGEFVSSSSSSACSGRCRTC